MNLKLIIYLTISVCFCNGCLDYNKDAIDRDTASFVTLAETYVLNEHKTGFLDSLTHSRAFNDLTSDKHQYSIDIHVIKYPDTPTTESVYSQENLNAVSKEKNENLEKGTAGIAFGTGLDLERQFKVQYTLFRLKEDYARPYRYCLTAKLLSARLIAKEPMEGYMAETIIYYNKYY